MNIKNAFLVVLVILLIGPGWLGAEEAVLEGLSNPSDLHVDDQYLYVADGTSVFIYDLEDFKRVRRFGSAGEGPGQFLGSATTGRAPLVLDILPDRILVNSYGKVSYFTREGEFIRELRVPDNSRYFIAFGEGYAGELNQVFDEVRYRTLNLYDEQLRRGKLLFKRPHSLQGPGGGFNPFEGPRFMAAAGDRLYVCWEPQFRVRVYDPAGNQVDSITMEYERRKVTEADQREVTDLVKQHPRFKNMLQYLLPLDFPEYYPALQVMQLAGDRLYLITTPDAQGQRECCVFDLQGELIRKTAVDFKTPGRFGLYPFALRNDVLYQLVEDEDAEDWRLWYMKF